MMKTCSILLLIIKGVSLQCPISTFDNTVIKVNNARETITGCISPETITFKGHITAISINNQDNILDLNYGAVQNISSNFRLDLRNNRIEFIREGAFLNLPGLYYINLRYNEITWIAKNSFKDLPSLGELLLSDNKITVVWQQAFTNLPKLMYIAFTGNKLDRFDQDWFSGTPNVERLYFGYNQLREITRGAFINLPNLKFLLFAQNLIEYIDPDAFKGLRNLEKVTFEDNRLRSIELNLHTPSKLAELYIMFNNITYISDRMLQTLQPSLKSFEVYRNPWQCSCLDKIVTWGLKNNISVNAGWFRPELKATAVCVLPTTFSQECLDRSDEEYEKGFWAHVWKKKDY